MTDPTLAKLRNLLLNEFSEQELEKLCQDIGLNYVSLPGTGAFGKTRGLIETARTQDKLRLLQNKVRELRPEAFANADFQTPVAVPVELGVNASVAETPTAPYTARAARTARASTVSSQRPAWLPILAIGLVALLCIAALAALLINRSGSGAGTTAELVGTSTPAAAISSSSGGEVEQVSTIAPAIPEGTSSVPQPESTALPVLTQTTQAAPTPTATSLPTPIPTPTEIGPTATSNAIELHPAARTILDLNQQLPEFYLGKVTADDLETFWTGDAWRSVVNFGSTKLPRVMRIPATDRSDLDVTYQYVRRPALVAERGTNATVSAQEYWRYVNAKNNIEICETREYTYNLVKTGEQFKVREFNSRLLNSGC
jgi:hypothetical protein